MYQGECYNASNTRVPVVLPAVTVNVIDVLYGDANGDEVVDLLDVLLLRKYLVNLDQFTGESSVAVTSGADVNGDGAVDLVDVLMLRRYLVDRDPETGESSVVLGPPIEPSKPSDPDVGGDDEVNYTYRSYDTMLPSNWNALSYQFANEQELIEYLNSPLFVADFKFDENGEIIPGEHVVEYGAAIGLEDVTAQYAKDWNLPGQRGYAFKITLRDDLQWENGDPIVAADFVYTMQEQLSPLFRHYRAGDYYGGTFSIAGAAQYVNAGQSITIDNGATQDYRIDDLVKGADGNYYTPDGYTVYIAVDYSISWCGGNTLKQYIDAYGNTYFGLERWDELVALMDDQGLVPANDETLAMLSATTTTNPQWGETDADLYRYLVYQCVYPECSFDSVGLMATDTYELLLILDKPLELLDDEGNLTYVCVTEFPGLPLVHQATYEACKIAPENEGELWTSNYNTSKETTMSWGAYKLQSFQEDKEYVLVRNSNWYGYRLEENKGLYQTDRIVQQVIYEWDTAWQMFLNGQLDSINLDNTYVASDYRDSSRTYFTPGQAVYFLILNGNMPMIREREAASGFDQTQYDLETLTLESFHRALNLSYDRDAYCSSLNPAQSAAFGLIGSAYIYDPYTGARYRDTDQAKQVLCDVYGVDVSKYESLDAAVDSITGYDPAAANAWFAQAYAEALAAGYITDNDDDGKSDQQIEMLYAISSGPSEKIKNTMQWLSDCANEAAKGTGFEGKISVVASEPLNSEWAYYTRNGQTDCVLGGWTGSVMDPYSLMNVYTDPGYQYDAAWFDSTSIMLTLNLRGEDITMNLQQWQQCMTGNAIEVGGKIYNFGAGMATDEERLTILAALEKEILLAYNYLPMTEAGALSMLSGKLDYITDDYNTFMGFGGLKYATYNFTDAEWAAYVASHNGDLSEEYKKSESTGDDVTFVDEPYADFAYKFAVQQNNLGQILYFTGEMSGYYLATSADPADAVDVFVENVDGGGLRLYFMADEVKTYIDVVARGEDQPSKVNVVLTDAPTCLYTWDSVRRTFVTYAVADNAWYLGCYNTYNTLSASQIKYIENTEVIGVSQFPAGLCTV